MKQYRKALRLLLEEGNVKTDRTGTGTISYFGHQIKYDISGDKLPLLQGKRVPPKSIAHELIWFLRGDTDIHYLEKNGSKIWREWAYNRYIKSQSAIGGEIVSMEDFAKECADNKSFAEKYSLGEGTYGASWRRFGRDTDQIKNVIENIKNNPDSRRHYVSAWQADKIDSTELPPCHVSFQFYVHDQKLSCHLNMRSNDMFLGHPANAYEYALLTHLIAHICGLKGHELTISIGDMHLYQNHQKQVQEYLSRNIYREKEPTVKFLREIDDIDTFTIDDFEIQGYDPLPSIKAPVAV